MRCGNCGSKNITEGQFRNICNDCGEHGCSLAQVEAEDQYNKSVDAQLYKLIEPSHPTIPLVEIPQVIPEEAWTEMKAQEMWSPIDRECELKSNGHIWMKRDKDKYEFCKNCLNIRRKDDKNSPCKGKVKITMRNKLENEK